MDQAKSDLSPRSEQDKFLQVPHKDRWNYLKPVIVQLYTGNYGNGGRKTATVAQVVEFMKIHYAFHATPKEYQNHFKQWNISKRLVVDEKDKIASVLGRRKRTGTSTSQIVIQQGDRVKDFDSNKLARYIKGRNTLQQIEPMAPGLLSSWTLPYAAFVSALPYDPNGVSPFGPLGSTPENIKVRSPEALTPGREARGPSPTMELVYQYTKMQHTALLFQGRLKELFMSISSEERRNMVNYFHDFYLHGFSLAKFWGRNTSNIGRAQTPVSEPITSHAPNAWTPSILLDLHSNASSPSSSRIIDISSPPKQLCQWSIHTRFMPYEKVPSPDSTPSPNSFMGQLHQSILHHEFTEIPQSDLPIAQGIIKESLEMHPTNLQLDAFKLAIMAGNYDLLHQLCSENYDEPPEELEKIHPFHLAASYLNGGHICCQVFKTLADYMGPAYIFHHNYDDNGHTVLDALMVSILRSHTSIQPDTVSSGFRSPNVFPGEAQDICGRWDIETYQVRELFSQGYARIPDKWKHPFCHSAVQAVCHCIITIFAAPISPDINTQSGLFLRRCTECGLELKLGPLHTLVVVAFYLAQSGMPGETLFGALAVMVSLLSMGADSCAKANMSVEEILGTAPSGGCHHAPLSPLELMERVPENVMRNWTHDCRTGWTCLLQVISRTEIDREWKVNPYSPTDSTISSPESSDDDSDTAMKESSYRIECPLGHGVHGSWLRLSCNGKALGLLWASIQTELLTYRRIGMEDKWISDEFSMEKLRDWLEGKSDEISIGLVHNAMMKEHSPCGWFLQSRDFLHPTSEDVSAEHFMNMDIHERTSFLEYLSLLDLWEDIYRDGIYSK